jgi:ParB family transcriptional regulator, chromosome partitioning protein
LSTFFGNSAGTRKKEERTTAEIQLIPVNKIVFSPFQARMTFGDQELGELAQSIKEHGVLQPVLARPFNKGFELIAGQRRVMAAKLAGLDQVPAVVMEIDDSAAAILGLVENLQREDLDPIEEADGYRRLIDEFNLTQEALAQRVGKSQSNIANKLRLLRLPDEVKGAISREIITERHARALLGLTDAAAQVRALQDIVTRNLNVQQTEEYVEGAISAAATGKSAQTTKTGKGRRLQVVRDVRIFLNGFRQAVKAIRNAGLEATIDEQDEGDLIRIVVTVAKGKTHGSRKTDRPGR